MKYNYVILSTDWDMYRQLYSDVIGRDDVCYVAGPQAYKKGLEKLLYRAHFNKKLNGLVMLPFKGIWNRSYFANPFNDNKPICFLLFRDWISIDFYTGYISWLKRRYPNSRFVWFLHDLLAEHRDFYTGKILDINRYKQDLDLIVTCNPLEASRYGLFYHSVPISKLCKDEKGSRYDVLFIGKDKGRLDRLIRIYDALTLKGARCRFFISEVPEVSRQSIIDSNRAGITLLDNPMSYLDCQSLVAESKCLLELRYDSAAGQTIRVSEALLYGKKLITDNPALAGNSSFDSESIRILAPDDDTDQIDLQFLTSSKDVSAEKTEVYRKQLSPAVFLEEIESLLS